MFTAAKIRKIRQKTWCLQVIFFKDKETYDFSDFANRANSSVTSCHLFGFLIIPVVCHLSFLPGQYVQFQCLEDQEAELFFAGEVEKKVDEADVVTQT